VSLIGYLSALTLRRKDFKVLFLIFILGILFFGFSSHKSLLVYPFASMAGYFFLKMRRPYLLLMICISITSILIILNPYTQIRLLEGIFANRTIFLPSQINFFYFDYFSNNTHMLWAESKISFGLIASNLPLDVMHYIGGLMTGSYEICANTGWVANAYMNAGIIGIFIYAFIIASMFFFIDLWAKRYGLQLVGAAFLVPIINLIMSADLFIIFLTYGLFFLLLIFELTSISVKTSSYNYYKNKRIIQILNDPIL